MQYRYSFDTEHYKYKKLSNLNYMYNGTPNNSGDKDGM